MKYVYAGDPKENYKGCAKGYIKFTLPEGDIVMPHGKPVEVPDSLVPKLKQCREFMEPAEYDKVVKTAKEAEIEAAEEEAASKKKSKK